MQFVMNKWTLVKGNDEQLVVHMLDTDGTPLNLTGASHVYLKMPLTDGSVLKKESSQGFSFGYLRPVFIYGFLLTAADLALMSVGTNKDVEVEVDYGDHAITKTFPIKSSLNIVDEVFP